MRSLIGAVVLVAVSCGASQPEIEREVEKLYRVFPDEVADKIKKKLGK